MATYIIPLTYWLDYSDRHPVDEDGQMPIEIKVAGSRATIEANAEQRKYLLDDARHYAEGWTDTDWPALVRGAKRVVKILGAA